MVRTHEELTRLARRTFETDARDDEYEIVKLPDGDVQGITVGWQRSARGEIDLPNPDKWLNEGKRGIIFEGKGAGRTHIRPNLSDYIAIASSAHGGEVRTRNATVHVGSIGLRMGLAGWTLRAGSLLGGEDLEVITDGPDTAFQSGDRGKWGVFTYMSDEHWKNCDFNVTHLAEHAAYKHGSAGRGSLWDKCHIASVGGQGIKWRSAKHLYGPGSDPETAWAGPNAALIVLDCKIEDWFQEWADRGGAGIVCEGGGGHVWVQRTAFVPGMTGHSAASAAQRAYAFTISSESDSYDWMTGRVGVGDGNGYVTLKDCIMGSGGRGNSDYTNKIVRVKRTHGNQRACTALVVDGCGVFGEKMQVELESDGPLAFPYEIRGCNTDAHKTYAREQLGIDSTHEAEYIVNGLHPMSEDISRT